MKRRGRNRQEGDCLGSCHVEFDPTAEIKHIRKTILDALDPEKAPGKIRTFAEMTDEEKEQIRRKYEHDKGERK